MYLWRRFASPKWANENEETLRTIVGDGLAVIERPNRKRLQFEFVSNRQAELENVAKRFGGRIEKLARDWLKRSLSHKTKPIKIGTKRLNIPAGAAFGTGDHATTAMSLRLLERVISGWEAQTPSPKRSSQRSSRWQRRNREHARRVRPPGLIVDLGTGSGILTLAARCLGARRAIGIDKDPIAISTAKQNARLNKIGQMSFRVADVRTWRLPRQTDIVTANLFSELLIEILPKLRATRWLVLSGILRRQERELRRALRRNKIDIIEARRRGKWVAILAANR
jgi:ribosomal protein L11 methyltransferase